MTETAKAMMTDAEAMALHQAYIDKHKKAFRVAFDALNRCMPPENSVEYFSEKAIPICQKAYEDVADNPLGKRLVIDVFCHLEDMAKEIAKSGEK